MDFRANFETHLDLFDIITTAHLNHFSHMKSVSPSQVLKKRQNLLAWLPVEKGFAGSSWMYP